MMYKRVAFIAIALLLTRMPVALAQVPQYPVTLTREAGAPVTVTNVAQYLRSESRGNVVLNNQHLYCISFAAAERAVRSVTFELAHKRADGTVSEVAVIKRDGDFSPGVPIKGYEGEAVRGAGDRHALANCVPLSMAFGDATITEIRPITVVYADNSQWVSSRAPYVVATSEPVGDDNPPVWDSEHHAGYIAVPSGGGTLGKPEQQTIQLYAPGHRASSATIAVDRCCASALHFDPAGNLIAESADGILVFAPGRLKPEHRFPKRKGFSLAVGPNGDIAAGGSNQTNDVEVFPADVGASYTIASSPTIGGIAISKSGELAIVDEKTGLLQTYARGSTDPSRSIVVNATPPKYGARVIGAVGYDPKGQLAVWKRYAGVISVYAPGKDMPTYEIRAGGDFAFDGAGNLIVVTAQATGIFSAADGHLISTLPRGGGQVAASTTSRRYAIRDVYRKELVVREADGSETIVPNIPAGSGLAISP